MRRRGERPVIRAGRRSAQPRRGRGGRRPRARSSGGATPYRAADSGSSGLGGISSPETWSQRGLSSGRPATIAGPLSPPRAIARGLARLSFPLGLFGPWHFMQCALRIGTISRASRETRRPPRRAPPLAKAAGLRRPGLARAVARFPHPVWSLDGSLAYSMQLSSVARLAQAALVCARPRRGGPHLHDNIERFPRGRCQSPMTDCDTKAY